MRVLGWIAAVLFGLPVVLVLLVFVLLNTGFGRAEVERLAGSLSGGQVVLTGLSGRFPDALRLAHGEIHDTQGAWLVLDDVALDWSPTRLLAREAAVDLLNARRIQVLRLPVAAPAPPTPSSSSAPFSLPVRVSVQSLRVERAEIAAPVAGVAATLALAGHAHLASLDAGDADVAIDRLDAPGSYTLQGRIDPAGIAAQLRLAEPAGGLVASIAKLPDVGAIAVTATLDGPRAAEATTLEVRAGPLTATAKGTLDLVHAAAALDVQADAPAMTPAPGVAWQAIALAAHVSGPFTRPDATGQLTVSGLAAFGAGFDTLAAQLQGNQGQAGLRATITGLRIPGPSPALFAAAPVSLAASVRLDDAKRPITFSLDHPLLQAQGTAETADGLAAKLDLTLPDLSPLAALGGVALAGRSRLAIQATQSAGATRLELDGSLAVTGGQAPVPALLGDAARLGVTLTLAGPDITLSRATLNGRKVTLAATGSDRGGVLDLVYTLGLTDLAALAPKAEGAVTLRGTAKGRPDDLALDTTLSGDAGTPGVARGPVSAALHATGLPGHPAGTVTAAGTLLGAPLDLALRATRDPAGTLAATIDRADWKSLHAEGALTLAPGAALPLGRVSLRVARLDDLRPFAGQPVSGALIAEAILAASDIRLTLDATRAGVPAGQVGRASLVARVADPLAHPVMEATIDVSGLAAAGIGGSAKLTARGPLAALALRLNAALTGVAGADATLATAAIVNVPGKTVQIASLQAVWREQTLRLLGPARIGFGDGVAVDRLRLGLQQAVLDVAGRMTPALDLTASLRGVTPDLAKPFVPGLDAAGQITADARLTGSPAAPQGTLRLSATGLRMRSGPGRALPAADITATAQLAGAVANVDARLAAGASRLAVGGQVPLGAGPLALRATGAVELAMLDRILSPDGRRVRGRVALEAMVDGTTVAPAINGTLTLAGGELQDFTQGVHLTALAATVQASGQSVRIASLTGRAGAGTVAASGGVGLQAPMPVDLTVTLRGARALASDRLTADVDADLAVRGTIETGLAATGTVAIQRASINIPEHLPASVAVLNVRVAGQKPPPPAKPGPVVRLDLKLTTPGQIFVRGRGLDAVLGGSLQVGGTTAAPQVSGGFDMRRGTFSLAGTTLTFSRGAVSFNGAGPTGGIDPSLDFEADGVTSTVTAMLLVGGYASAPKITLSSTPALPQDEVLAQLLFGRSAKDLGPFQYAEIAAALADLSGATSVGNPLDRVRKGLGLDRLSVGGAAPGTTGSSSAATVEAGRYVANGVYVGAKQGTTGAQMQATVQIDITKGLKAETDVGTGVGGNSVGLTYQFDY